MNATHKKQFEDYLKLRDLTNGEPYSWFDIYTNKFNHKDKLEEIVSLKLSLTDYQKLLDKRQVGFID